MTEKPKRLLLGRKMGRARRARIALERVRQAIDALACVEYGELVLECDPAWFDVREAWQALDRASVILARQRDGLPMPPWIGDRR